MSMSHAALKLTRAVLLKPILPRLAHAGSAAIGGGVAAQPSAGVATAAAAALSSRTPALTRPVATRLVDTPQPAFDVLAMSSMQPHPDKKNKGEDAFFIKNGSDWLVTGIADGVGGWSMEGIDAGEFARELMDRAAAAAADSHLRKQPAELMHLAHTQLNHKTRGSCTACIVVFEGNKLRYANLGDSGLLGYRSHSSTVFLRTKEQQHRWNCPFQLGSECSDNASLADVGEHSVQHNDIIVLGTDGFFDNLYDGDIADLINRFIVADELRANWPQTEEQLRAAAAKLQLQMATLKVTPNNTAMASSNANANGDAMTEKAKQMAASLSSASAAANPIPSSPRSPSPIPFTTTPSPPTPAVPSATASVSTSASSATTRPHSLSADSLQRLAHLLVKEALKKANDHQARTPFSDNAKKHGKRFKGGKLDDVTVVVVQVRAAAADAAADAAQL